MICDGGGGGGGGDHNLNHKPSLVIILALATTILHKRFKQLKPAFTMPSGLTIIGKKIADGFIPLLFWQQYPCQHPHPHQCHSHHRNHVQNPQQHHLHLRRILLVLGLIRGGPTEHPFT